MKKIFFLLLVLIPFLASAQKNKSALKLYKLGVESFNNKDYKTADSLFTKSVELEPYPNTYFNLASTKKKLGDNCGFCNCIEMASKLGDEEASKLFSSRCFTYDTTFYEKDTSRFSSVVTTESCTKKRSQSFFIKMQDSVKYNFAFLDSTEELSIKVFDDFPDPDSILNQLIFYKTDEMPSFNGSEKNLFDFIKRNVRYPNEARELQITGKVLVSFIVMEDGTLKNIKIKKSVHPILDKEVIRVVKLMKEWTPGRYNNNPVKVFYVMPCNFTLQ